MKQTEQVFYRCVKRIKLTHRHNGKKQCTYIINRGSIWTKHEEIPCEQGCIALKNIDSRYWSAVPIENFLFNFRVHHGEVK